MQIYILAGTQMILSRRLKVRTIRNTAKFYFCVPSLYPASFFCWHILSSLLCLTKSCLFFEDQCNCHPACECSLFSSFSNYRQLLLPLCCHNPTEVFKQFSPLVDFKCLKLSIFVLIIIAMFQRLSQHLSSILSFSFLSSPMAWVL